MRARTVLLAIAVLIPAMLCVDSVTQFGARSSVRAASVNSYSTLGTISMDATTCGADDTNSVVLGTGIRRIVDAGGGVVYVVGCFLNFSGVPEADFVAKWDGTSWSGLGNSGDLNGIVYDAVIYKGNLVIVGNFENAGGTSQADMIARWDPNLNSGVGGWAAFESVARPPMSLECSGGDGSPKDGLSDYLSAIAVDDKGTAGDTSDDALIVGGYLYNGVCSGSSGYQIANTKNLARWTGTAWESVDDSSAFHSFYGTTYIPRSILVDSGTIYIGSYRLTALGFSDGVSKYKHAFIVYDGTSYSYPITSLSTYGDGSGNGVFTLAKNGTAILLGGNFSSLNGSAYHLAQYESGAISAFNNFSVGGASGAVVRDIEVVGSQVIVAGAFAAGPTGSIGSSIARWNGTSWSGFTNSAVFSANALAVDSINSRLYVGSGNSDMGGISGADGLLGVSLTNVAGFDTITSTNATTPLSYDPATGSYSLDLLSGSATEVFGVVSKESAVKVTATVDGTTNVITDGSFTLSVPIGESKTVDFTSDSTDGTSSVTVSITVRRAAAPVTTTTTATTTTASTTTTTTATTTTTIAPPARPEVRVNGLVSLRSIAQFAGLALPGGSILTATVADASRLVCKVQGASIKGLKRGRCTLTLRVTRANGQRTTRSTFVQVR